MPARLPLLMLLGLCLGCGCNAIDAAFGFKPDAPPNRPTVGYSSKIGNSDADDRDYAPDPQTDTQRNFAENTRAAQDDDRPERPVSHDRIFCLQLLDRANGKTAACAAELLSDNCGRGNRVVESECPHCAELSRLDSALSGGGCPARPRYPPLREGS